MPVKGIPKPSVNGNGVAPEGRTIITITPPKFRTMEVPITGAAPLMIHRFAKKAELMAIHEEGSQVRQGRKKKDPRDFERDYKAAKYTDAKKGWEGFNASAVRDAMISACRTVGVKMTQAKLAVFVEADGYDADGIPLVRISGKSVRDIRPARNQTGVIDLRARPRYDEWSATLRLRFDEDMMTAQDVANLLSRAGMQVGIGEGRPDSRQSAGIGYGLFKVVGWK